MEISTLFLICLKKEQRLKSLAALVFRLIGQQDTITLKQLSFLLAKEHPQMEIAKV